MTKNCIDSYYVEKYFKKKNKKRTIIKATLCFFIVIFFIYLILSFISKKVNPIIVSFSESTISNLLTNSCNEAISQCASQIEYDNLIYIKYDSNNSVSEIHANIEQVNKLSNFLATYTQSKIDEGCKSGLQISIGTLSGIGFLLGRGQVIKFNINTIGNVICKFNSEFLTAGINQTVHRILINIEAECFLTLPFSTIRIKKNIDYLVSESIIVGKVPEVYLNGQTLGKSLNLIP